MEKVSVIIPVYNAGEYIRQCLRSVTDQTWKNLEILVIDDGSTDQSPEICREYEASDGRIHVFRQENQGVSAARNRGLDMIGGADMYFFWTATTGSTPCFSKSLSVKWRNTACPLHFATMRSWIQGRWKRL